MKFLVVDDEPEILETMAFFIDVTGHSVETCSKPELALRLDDDFDAIISDYNMPNMNGYDFLEQSKGKWPNSIRVLISGFREPMEMKDKRTLVHKAFAKPFAIEEMLGEIVKYAKESSFPI